MVPGGLKSVFDWFSCSGTTATSLTHNKVVPFTLFVVRSCGTTVFLHKDLGMGALTVGGNETNPRSSLQKHIDSSPTWLHIDSGSVHSAWKPALTTRTNRVFFEKKSNRTSTNGLLSCVASWGLQGSRICQNSASRTTRHHEGSLNAGFGYDFRWPDSFKK